MSTFPGLYLVEKMGRRNLLLLGAVGMTCSQFIVAITGTVAGTTDLAAQRAAIAFVCIYIYFFASSWGPVAWVVTGKKQWGNPTSTKLLYRSRLEEPHESANT